VLRIWTFAAAVFVALTLAAMGAIHLTTSAPAAAVARPAERADAPVVDPSAPTAPLVVLPPPPAPPPYVPPPGVRIETLAPPPPVAAEPEARARELVAFRETRRATAMDQLNAREALRRKRLGLPPPAPIALGPGAPRPRAGSERAAKPSAGARRPGPTQEYGTP
jgi:hypothetical protein